MLTGNRILNSKYNNNGLRGVYMIKNKRFLISHIWLKGFGGAEINILELTKYLLSKGAYVDIFTYVLKNPLMEEFEKLNVNIITDINYNFKLKEYDYVWSCQNIIPNNMIQDLAMHKNGELPYFIFMHMAALPEYVLEQPYIFDLENRISSKTLAISDEIVKKNLSNFFDKIPSLSYYRNPAPVEFCRIKKDNCKRLSKILAISNHPPEEIKELSEYEDIEIDFMGVWSDNYKLATAELFNQYDCVIGIGKNVQYCLVSSIPIYIYDHFGGPGYLNEDNYSLSEQNNFSGRGFGKKTSQTIYNELINNYKLALEYQSANRKGYIEKFSINEVVPNILKTLNKKKDISLSYKYVNYIISINRFVEDSYVKLTEDKNNLLDAIRFKDNELARISKDNDILRNDCISKDLELSSIKNTKFFKYYKIINKLFKS